MNQFNKRNLRIGTRIVLVFSIYDQETGENIVTAPDESFIREIYKDITGLEYSSKIGMESYDPRN